MSDQSEINIFRVLDYIRDNAKSYAQAKANRIYLEEYRKTLKASLMQKAQSQGVTASAAQERDAYAAPEYEAHLKALSAAVEEEESLRWLLIAAQAKVEVWRSIGANQRAIDKTL
jgi:hypothetical protein